MTLPAADVLSLDPDWQPFAYDAEADALTFVLAPRDIQQRRTFLDGRYLSDQPRTAPVPVSALHDAAATAGPVHFIFHTAFCCSTLLARAFDQPGAAMGLKEPAVLVTFADALAAHGHTPRYRQALHVTLDLLSRPLAPGETQIIKPTNLANPLVPMLLAARPQARAIIMHSPLEHYLKTTAKNALMGRSFNREALMQLKDAMPLHPDLSVDVIVRLTDLEVAALVWLMQARFFKRVIAEAEPARVRTLLASSLLARPSETLQRAGDFFDVSPATPWADVASGPLFHEHAKTLGRRFDADARAAELEAAGNAHAAEIGAVLRWARGLAEKLGGPLDLGDTLTDGTPALA